MPALQPLDTDIWLTEGPVVNFHGFPYPTRMVLVRLPDGALWVWSPVALTAELRAEVEAIGTPAHLVSPNAIHHIYLSEWHAAWPDAKLWGPAKTIKKRDDLPFQPALEDAAPDEWQGVFTQAWFRGSPLLDEIAFVHRPSSTAIFADLSENFSEDFVRTRWKAWQLPIARFWGIVEGKGHAPLEWRLSWFRRRPAREALAKILGAQPDRIIMAHGEWVDTGGEDFLLNSFSWLLKGRRP